MLMLAARRRPSGDEVEARRALLARALDRLVEVADRPGVGGPPVRASVVRTAAPALRAVAAMLADRRRPVATADLVAAELFLTDGARSPLYGHDAEHARTVAEDLVERLTGADPHACLA